MCNFYVYKMDLFKFKLFHFPPNGLYRTRRPYPLPRLATALTHLPWAGFNLATEGGILCTRILFSACVISSLRNAYFSVLRASGPSPRHERGDT